MTSAIPLDVFHELFAHVRGEEGPLLDFGSSGRGVWGLRVFRALYRALGVEGFRVLEF